MPEPAKLIIKAAKSGDVGTLKSLLAQDASLVNEFATRLLAVICPLDTLNEKRNGLFQVCTIDLREQSAKETNTQAASF